VTPPDAGAERLYADHLLARYRKVVRRLAGDVIEIELRAGHHLSMV
jgi:hypothetical protein